MRCNKENVRKWKIQVIFKVHGTLTNIYYDRYLRIWYVSRPGQRFERILKNDKMNKIRKHKETIGTYQSSKDTFIQPTVEMESSS